MISAADAYTLADNCRNERIEKEWEDLEKLIQADAEKGNFDCCYYGLIMPENKQKLEELGYKVEIESNYRENTVYINWGRNNE